MPPPPPPLLPLSRPKSPAEAKRRRQASVASRCAACVHNGESVEHCVMVGHVTAAKPTATATAGGTPMVDASTAPSAVPAAVPGFVAVGSSSGADAARRPVRPLKRSRKEQAAEAAGLSVGVQAGGFLPAAKRNATAGGTPCSGPALAAATSASASAAVAAEVLWVKGNGGAQCSKYDSRGRGWFCKFTAVHGSPRCPRQGLTLVHVTAQLEQLQVALMSSVGVYGGQKSKN
jgi:hypothetical protein